MTYKELLELLSQKNKSGGWGANIYGGLKDFFSRGGGSYHGQSERPQLPQYPSSVYPDRTGGGMEPIPYDELSSEKRRLLDERQAYTQALIPINDTLSYTDGSRTMIYDSSTGKIYPAEDLYNTLKPRDFPQYPSSIYPTREDLVSEPQPVKSTTRPEPPLYTSPGVTPRPPGEVAYPTWERRNYTTESYINRGGSDYSQQLNRLQEERAQKAQDFKKRSPYSF